MMDETKTETLVVLGTGNAQAVNCYNTCFALCGAGKALLVDAGGGNGIMMQLRRAGLRWSDLGGMIVTHAHTDHILGVVWVLRMVATAMLKGSYTGTFPVWGHADVLETLQTICRLTLQKKHYDCIGKGITLNEAQDGARTTLCGQRVQFFDIHSSKLKQYGFTYGLTGGKTLCCLGDEPYNPLCAPYAQNADWLLSEAFCRKSDSEIYKPYEKHHSTVADACRTAEELGAKNLVLWHTEDDHMVDRRTLYAAEGAPLFSGRLFVPDDLDVLELN